MSLTAIRAGVAAALSALADPSMTYRAGPSGAWVALPYSLLVTDPAQAVGYDADEGGEVAVETALLTCSLDAPVLAIDYQVKDHLGAVWAVLGPDQAVADRRYRLRRMTLSDAAYSDRRGGEER